MSSHTYHGCMRRALVGFRRCFTFFQTSARAALGCVRFAQLQPAKDTVSFYLSLSLSLDKSLPVRLNITSTTGFKGTSSAPCARPLVVRKQKQKNKTKTDTESTVCLSRHDVVAALSSFPLSRPHTNAHIHTYTDTERREPNWSRYGLLAECVPALARCAAPSAPRVVKRFRSVRVRISFFKSFCSVPSPEAPEEGATCKAECTGLYVYGTQGCVRSRTKRYGDSAGNDILPARPSHLPPSSKDSKAVEPMEPLFAVRWCRRASQLTRSPLPTGGVPA